MDQETKDDLDRKWAYALEETDRRFAKVGAKIDRCFEAIARQNAKLRQDLHEIGILIEEIRSRFQALAE